MRELFTQINERSVERRKDSVRDDPDAGPKIGVRRRRLGASSGGVVVAVAAGDWRVLRVTASTRR